MKNDNQNNAADLINYKGIYYDDDSGVKFQCPITGAHFEYVDMFRRLKKIFNQRQKQEKAEKQAAIVQDKQVEVTATSELKQNVEAKLNVNQKDSKDVS